MASWNRVAEPERLLRSLDAQKFRDFEVILADQNSDERLDAILREHSSLRVKHLRLERGLSKARNAALRVVGGDIIAFPDDDCWYPPELLARVAEWFQAHPEFAVLFTATRNQHGQIMAPKFAPKQGPCTKTTVLKCAVTFNAFLRIEAVRTIGFFREDIGPGTSSSYQSGEDLDYMIRAIELGFPAWYEPGLTVFHPNFKDEGRLLAKMYSYALGVGLILRSHSYPWWVISEVVARSLCGAAVYACKLNFKLARLYALRAKGQVQGYFGTAR